jgi:hypothetical protein
MYKKDDKQRLYWLIDEYLAGNIDESTFCDEFYYSYDLEIDNNILNNNEQQAFSELSKITSRFSQYEEDHKLDEQAFSTVSELRHKIIETKGKLKSL